MTVCGATIRWDIPLGSDINAEIITTSHYYYYFSFLGTTGIFLTFCCHLVAPLYQKGPDPRTGARSFRGPAEGPEPESTIPGLIQWCFTP